MDSRCPQCYQLAESHYVDNYRMCLNCINSYKRESEQSGDDFTDYVKDMLMRANTGKDTEINVYLDPNYDPKDELSPYERGLFELDQLKPSMIKEYLDDYVINQDEVKESLAIAAVNHMYRVFHNESNPDMQLKKSCLMITGPTGVGKTLSISKLADFLDIPFINVDCTELTSAGYVGRDVGDIFRDVVTENAKDPYWDGNVIVYLDEIDKIAKSSSDRGKDVNGAAVQQSLLRMVEGGEVSIEGKNNGVSRTPDLTFDTKNVLFIMSGAFTDLRENLNRKSQKTPLGFGTNEKGFKLKITPKDLIDAGMLRELIGRVGRIVEAQPLDSDAMKRVLTEPVDSIMNQYKTLFELRELEFDFDSLDLDEIVAEAVKKKVGARGLRNILEERLHEHMYV